MSDEVVRRHSDQIVICAHILPRTTGASTGQPLTCHHPIFNRSVFMPSKSASLFRGNSIPGLLEVRLTRQLKLFHCIDAKTGCNVNKFR